MVQQSTDGNPNWEKELEAFYKKYHFVFDEDVLAEAAIIVREKTSSDFTLTSKPSTFIYGVTKKVQKRKRSKEWKKNNFLSKLLLNIEQEPTTNYNDDIRTELLESPQYFKKLYTRLNYFRIMQRLSIPKEQERLKMLIARKRDGQGWEEIFEELKINRSYDAAKAALSAYLKRLKRILPKPSYPILDDIVYGVKMDFNCPYLGITIYDANEYSLRQFFQTIDEILNKQVLFIGQCRGDRCSAMTLLAAHNHTWDILIVNKEEIKLPRKIKIKTQPDYVPSLELALQIALRRLPQYGAIIVDSSVHGRFNNLARALEDYKLMSDLLSPLVTTD